jgi:aryl-alcohol dehydrogenase-like predicted oxidoreductase
MQTITLGESSLECSRLAYGCWRVTGVITHPPIDNEREKRGYDAITAAYEAGYTMFDLADIYSEGLVEEVFGRTLKGVPGMRDNIVVTTKCGIRQKGDPDKGSPHRYDLSRPHRPLVRSVAQAHGHRLHRPVPAAPAGLPDGAGRNRQGVR